MSLPDLTRPLIGYRWFGLVAPHFLSSPQVGSIWEPDRVVEATCGVNHGPSPYQGCLCGWNAYKSRSDVLWTDPSQMVLGKVALWGRVHKYRKGYRAQYARVVEVSPIITTMAGLLILKPFDDMMQAIADRYHCAIGEPLRVNVMAMSEFQTTMTLTPLKLLA